MSAFGKLFGRKKENVPTTQESLQKLRDTEDMLMKKMDFTEKKIEHELQEAKKYGTKNKRQALQCLRRKKKLEEQLMHIDGILNRIQTQKDSLENASVNASVLSTLADSAKALKHAHNDMDVDKVHDLMEEITEQQELANEIAEAISNPMGMDNMDEDDLLAELEKLEEEDLDKQLLNVGPAPVDVHLPEAPTEDLPKVPKAKSKEEDEMAQLQAWADA